MRRTVVNLTFSCLPVPLFLGAAASDIAYYFTYEIQWSNFASWLLVGGMVFAVIALLVSLFNSVFGGPAPRRWWLPMALGALCVFGLWNSFEHAKDGWAIMPTALVLSIVAYAFAKLAAWIAFCDANREHTV